MDFKVLSAALPEKRRRRLSVGAAARPGPLFAYALLRYAMRRDFGVDPRRLISLGKNGKPYLRGTALHFSISHTKTHVLCAVGDASLGADIETVRPVSAALIRYVLAENERPEDFFQLWTLKESYIKLLGQKDRPFRQISFSMDKNGVRCDIADVFCAVFAGIPHCAAAVCAAAPFDPPAPEYIPCSALLGPAVPDGG